jgi:hypothetical protein
MMKRRIPLILCLLLTGCAYGYAGQEAKTRTDPRDQPKKSNVRVVEVSEKEKEASDDETAGEAPPPAEDTSPCGVDTFDIYYFTGSTQVTKTIDCIERKVTNVNRTPMGETTYVDAKAAGLPEGSWYILVDPKAIRANYLNNDHLLKLSREFEIEYFGRDASRDLLVYLFKEELQ